MKYKVGDKVKIREDLVVGNVYGAEVFVANMGHYKGNMATITTIRDDVCRINIDNDDIQEKCCWNWTDEMFEDIKIQPTLTVADLLNKTDVEKGGLIITVYYPNAYFEATIGHNKINRNSELYKRFIKAYGDMIVDEVSLDVEDDYAVVMKIKVDYAD